MVTEQHDLEHCMITEEMNWGKGTTRIFCKEFTHRIMIHGPRKENGLHDCALIRFDENGNAYLWREGDDQ